MNTTASMKPLKITTLDELKNEIKSIWSTVLNIQNIDIKANFFDLGGHSLLLNMVRDLIAERLGEKLTMVDMFCYPTIESLVSHLKDKLNI